jgi:DNA-binding MarR family transcriptional regulator
MQDAAARDIAVTSSDFDAAVMARFLARPGFLLARVDQIATSIHGGLSGGETPAQAEFLLLLDTLGAIPQIRLARAAGVDKSTTAYVLDNLQTRGLIARAACADDKRRALVSLTDAGKARIDRVRADHAELQRLLFAPLAEEDRPRLIAMLHKLGANPMSAAPLWVPACEPAIGVLDGAPSFLMRRALQSLQAQFLAAPSALNLTLRQFSLLFILSVRPSITQAGFARMFGLDPSTCAVIMRGLASRALIAAGPSAEDRRARVYAITDAGRGALVEVHPLVDRSEALVFRGESAAQLRWMVRQLQAIARQYSSQLRFPGMIDAL